MTDQFVEKFFIESSVGLNDNPLLVKEITRGAGTQIYIQEAPGQNGIFIRQEVDPADREHYTLVPTKLFETSEDFRAVLQGFGPKSPATINFIRNFKRENKMNTETTGTVVENGAATQDAPVAEAVKTAETVEAALPAIDATADDFLKATRNQFIFAGAAGALVTSVCASLKRGQGLIAGMGHAAVATAAGAGIGYGVFKTEMDKTPGLITAVALGSSAASITHLASGYMGRGKGEEKEIDTYVNDQVTVELELMPAPEALPAI